MQQRFRWLMFSVGVGSLRVDQYLTIAMLALIAALAGIFAMAIFGMWP